MEAAQFDAPPEVIPEPQQMWPRKKVIPQNVPSK